MRVFVTGGTGYLGRAVVDALLRGGHSVTVLTRDPEKAGRSEARLVRGDIKDPASYREAGAAQDAWLHLAFEYSNQTVDADRAAVDGLIALAKAASGPRVLVYTSGVWVLGDTGDPAADESASTERAAPLVAWRPAHERIVLNAAGGDLVTAAVRPGLVYGGQGGLTAKLFETAEQMGKASVVGDGRNRWSLVHREDLARYYRLIVERRVGGVFHAVDGVPVTAEEAGRAAARAAGKPPAVQLIPVEQARTELGPVADALCLDQLVVTKRAAELGWKPECASFVQCAGRAYGEWKAARDAAAS